MNTSEPTDPNPAHPDDRAQRGPADDSAAKSVLGSPVDLPTWSCAVASSPRRDALPEFDWPPPTGLWWETSSRPGLYAATAAARDHLSSSGDGP